MYAKKDKIVDDPASLHALMDEYSTILAVSGVPAQNDENETERLESVTSALVVEAHWTRQGAEHLVSLVEKYGAFVLRNAAALAIALGVEDGELGL